jgi:hypothetical protein
MAPTILSQLGGQPYLQIRGCGPAFFILHFSFLFPFSLKLTRVRPAAIFPVRRGDGCPHWEHVAMLAEVFRGRSRTEVFDSAFVDGQ